MNAKHLLHTLRSQERLCIVYSPMHAALLELVANNVENGGGSSRPSWLDTKLLQHAKRCRFGCSAGCID